MNIFTLFLLFLTYFVSLAMSANVPYYPEQVQPVYGQVGCCRSNFPGEILNKPHTKL